MLSNRTIPSLSLISPVLEKLNRIQPLSVQLQKKLIENSFLIEFNKGEYLLRTGECSKDIFFIVRGLVSGQTAFNGKTITTFISVDGHFVSAIEGLYGVVPSLEDIRAEENTLVLGIPTDQLQKLFDEHVELNILMRKILERYYQEAHKRSVFVRAGTAFEKYQYFVQNFPEHSSRIPLEVTASFLNLKLATLNKVIRECDQLIKKNTDSSALSKTAIEEYMKKIRPHLQKRLTLTQLAHQFNTSAHELSHFLNVYFNENFNHFINRHRVEYILSKLSNQKNLIQYSLEGLGEMAGFSSKTTFFSEFKKYTGKTPSGYINQDIKKA